MIAARAQCPCKHDYLNENIKSWNILEGRDNEGMLQDLRNEIDGGKQDSEIRTLSEDRMLTLFAIRRDVGRGIA